MSETMFEVRPGTVHAFNTKRIYKWIWGKFEKWCESIGYSQLPASDVTVCRFLEHLHTAGFSQGTARVAMAGIAAYHEHAGHTPPNPYHPIETYHRLWDPPTTLAEATQPTLF